MVFHHVRIKGLVFGTLSLLSDNLIRKSPLSLLTNPPDTMQRDFTSILSCHVISSEFWGFCVVYFMIYYATEIGILIAYTRTFMAATFLYLYFC